MSDVVAVVTDIFFQSRINVAAKPADRQIRFVASVDDLSGVREYDLALVDLDARLDVLAAIRALKERGSGPVVAFGPHLDTEGRKAARAAGADRVLARSKFVLELPRLLTRTVRDPGARTPQRAPSA
jgi:CheY-like chemotaxis protein